MNKEIEKYINDYPAEIKDMYLELRKILIESVSQDIEEYLWAKLPSYYSRDKFVRLIPFKNHINIEAKAIFNYKDDLSQFKITPKGMLQVFIGQSIPEDILGQVFKETLLNER